MIVYLANKTQFREDILKERGRLAHSCKVTSTFASAFLGDLCAFAVKNSSSIMRGCLNIAEGRDRSSGRSGAWVANGFVNAWAVRLSDSLFIHISCTGPLGETVPAIFKTGSERNVVISDTHRGNLILMDDRLLAPIDLRVQALSGALLDTVAKLCQCP